MKTAGTPGSDPRDLAQMNTAYLGVGGNLGNRWERLAEAQRGLAADPGLTVVRASSVYESTPVGRTDQPDFLNQVLEVATTYAPRDLLTVCLALEQRLGRIRYEHWGPRIIDVDVLSYWTPAGDKENPLRTEIIWSDPDLILPHPRMAERSFVLTPLAEIAPDLTVHGVSVRVLAARVGPAGLWRAATNQP